MKAPTPAGRKALRRCVRVFMPGFLLAVACFVLLGYAMEPVSTNAYCGSACHEMNVSYQTWELSSHGSNPLGVRADCIDCHLPPRTDFFHHLVAKAYAGGKDLYHHHLGPAYDRAAQIRHVSARLPNARCEHCHDALLARPSSSAARQAHTAVRAQPDAPESRCVSCHPHVGHERQRKLFTP